MKAITRYLAKRPLLLPLLVAVVGLLLLAERFYHVSPSTIDPSKLQTYLMCLLTLLAIWVGVLVASFYWGIKAVQNNHKDSKKLTQKLVKQNDEFEKKLDKDHSKLEDKIKKIEKLEFLLKDTQQQLTAQEKLASIGILAAGIAHEIKNPLNFVNNFSDMTIELIQELKEELAKGIDISTPQAKENLEGIVDDIMTNCKKINEHGKRAESIIKNMLIQARTSEVDKEPIDVNALLEEFMALAYHGMRAQNNTFNAKIEKKLDLNLPRVMGSPQSLGRVFLNIINNALYASNDKAQTTMKEVGGRPFMPTISLSTEKVDDTVIIKIRDNGDGIPEEIKQRIFERFFTTKPAGHGTGLGLPICFDIVVTEHSGKIEVNSNPGEYTEFVIQLPIGVEKQG